MVATSDFSEGALRLSALHIEIIPALRFGIWVVEGGVGVESQC